MTIDEAIAHAKEVANSWKLNQEDCDFNTNCNNCAESCEECAKEHEQLAEWLEELKTYKEKEFDVLRQDGQLLYKQGIIDGYDKAINKFAEQIKEVYPFTILELEQLEEIAEQLKKGKEE